MPWMGCGISGGTIKQSALFGLFTHRFFAETALTFAFLKVS
jgi:hypothetical protein